MQSNLPITLAHKTISLIGSAGMPSIPGSTVHGSYQSVITQGHYAYVAATAGSGAGIVGLTLVIYNIQNPAAPVQLGYLTTGSVPWTSGPSFLNGSYQMAINGNVLYVFSSGSSVLYSVDVSNPNNPTNIQGLTISGTPGSLYGGVYDNGYVYIATQNKGLTVVNVSNPAAMVQVFQEGGTTNKSIGVFVQGTYCYTTNYQTTSPWTVRYLKVWDITVPTAPVLLTTYTLPAGTKPAVVTVKDGTAYVSDLNTSTVQIVDVSTPTAPNYLASMQASASFNVENGIGLNSVTMTDQIVYIASGANATYGGAIDVYDITNKSAPVKKLTYTQGVPGGVFGAAYLANNMLYIADYGPAGSAGSTLDIYSTITATSSVLASFELQRVSVQATGLGSGTSGYMVLQGSDDASNPVNWSDVPGTMTTVSGTATVLIPSTGISYQFVRVSYSDFGTTGVFAAMKGLGL